MKRLLYLLALLTLTFGALQVSAQCGVEVDGPYTISGGVGVATYYVYGVPACGWSTSGPVSAATLSCSGSGGWSIGNTGWLNTPATIDTHFTVGSQVLNSSQWEIEANIQGSTPDANYYVYVEVDVTVVHTNNTSTTYSHILYWDGSQGNDNGCQKHGSDYFTATTGDTIYVHIQVGNPLGGGSVAIGNPVIFNIE